jgi:exodeoxyribonuclease VII large subunit
MRAVGASELAVLFEELKKKLGAEGLFDPARKRPLPLLPKSIGIVTSPTGAVLQDMVSIITRRFPGIQLVLCPVRVQGLGAGVEIASAIRLLNETDPVDVIVLARGGGSLEDLWPFNEESVARAIFSSHIPVVSAIGHEVDFTIADFVADLRAPTPSAAAELVVPDRSVLLGNLRQNCYYLQGIISSMLKRHRNTIRNIVRTHSFNYPLTLLAQVNQRRDELERGILASVSHRIALQKSSLSSLQKRVQLMNPNATLKRGYTLVYAGTELVKTSTELERGDSIDIRFHDGTVRSTVG